MLTRGYSGSAGYWGRNGANGSHGQAGVVKYIIHDPVTGNVLLDTDRRFNPVVKGIKILNEQGNDIYEPNSVLTISEVLISNDSNMAVPEGAKLLLSSHNLEWLDPVFLVLPAINPQSTRAIPALIRFRTPVSSLPKDPKPFSGYIRILATLTLLDHPFHSTNPVFVLGIQHSIKYGRIVAPCVLKRTQENKIVGLMHNIAPCQSSKRIRIVVEHHPNLLFETTSLELPPIEGLSARGFSLVLKISNVAQSGETFWWKIVLLLDEAPVEYFTGGNFQSH